MPTEFWAAVIGFLTAGAGLLSAIRQRIEKQKVQKQAQQDKIASELREQLERERREGAEREREAAREALEFRERLRQEGIAERAVLEDRVEDLARAVSASTKVMEDSTELTRRILDTVVERVDLRDRNDTSTRQPSRRSAATRRGGT